MYVGFSEAASSASDFSKHSSQGWRARARQVRPVNKHYCCRCAVAMHTRLVSGTLKPFHGHHYVSHSFEGWLFSTRLWCFLLDLLNLLLSRASLACDQFLLAPSCLPVEVRLPLILVERMHARHLRPRPQANIPCSMRYTTALTCVAGRSASALLMTLLSD